MMTSQELVESIEGRKNIETFKRVKKAYMRVASLARDLVAEDLNATIPEEGKQFIRTSLGKFRLSNGANSDNSTEMAAHDRMGAITVQIFGEPTEDARARGVISLALDEDLFLEDVVEAYENSL